MDQQERDAQRALGNLEEFRAIVTIPIKVKEKITRNVMAVSKEDAIEKIQLIHDIMPKNELLREATSKVQGFGNNTKFDDSTEREYDVKMLTRPKAAAGSLNVEEAQDSGCESSS
ncbi:hypothetical protein LCGC14_1736970 [marine sediment metagenome]|uniref:Uncharacterized protein n=1 Tax=marine sediment metagenome TaxID=412755 RepID=A0A0F9K7H6_9ZZZZ